MRAVVNNNSYAIRIFLNNGEVPGALHHLGTFRVKLGQEPQVPSTFAAFKHIRYLPLEQVLSEKQYFMVNIFRLDFAKRNTPLIRYSK